MATEEDQQRTVGDLSPNPSAVSLQLTLRSAALAAELLENACASGPSDSSRLEIVRTLARDLKRELEALTTLPGEGTGATWFEEVEGALRAADVANLAACAVPELPQAHASEAVAATHLAIGATRALGAFAEAGTEDMHKHQAPYVLRDLRGAVWRAGLAARQIDEFSGRAR